MGAVVQSIELETERLVITVSSPLSMDTLRAIAGTVPYLSPDVRDIVVRGAQGSLSGPAIVLQRFLRETDDDLKQAHFMRVVSSWRHGDVSLLSREAARLWTARRALHAAASLEPRAAIARLRTLIDLARDLDDTTLANALRQMTGGVRGRLTGLPTNDPRFLRSLERLKAWGMADVEWPPALE